MNAGVEMRFVRVISFCQNAVQNLVAVVEAVTVFGTAVEVNFHSLKFCGVLCKRQRIIGLPVSQVLRPAKIDSIDSIENCLECFQALAADSRAVEAWDESGAMCADSAEHFRVLHGDLQ